MKYAAFDRWRNGQGGTLAFIALVMAGGLLIGGLVDLRGLIRADDTKDVPKAALRAVAIDAKLVESYTAAQKRTFEAQQAVEKTPEWGVLMVRQSQEQSALLFIMAESGLKPTEGCQPVFDEKTHALLRFDCPEKKKP